MNFNEFFRPREYAPGRKARDLDIVREEPVLAIKDPQTLKIKKNRLDSVLIKLANDTSSLQPGEIEDLRKERNNLMKVLKASGVNVKQYRA